MNHEDLAKAVMGSVVQTCAEAYRHRLSVQEHTDLLRARLCETIHQGEYCDACYDSMPDLTAKAEQLK